MGTRGRGGGAVGTPGRQGDPVYPSAATQRGGGGDPGRGPAPVGGSPPRCHVPPASGSARTRCSLRLRGAPSHGGSQSEAPLGSRHRCWQSRPAARTTPARPGSRTLRGRPAARLAPPSLPPLAAGAGVTSTRAPPQPLPTSGLPGLTDSRRFPALVVYIHTPVHVGDYSSELGCGTPVLVHRTRPVRAHK